MIYADHSANRLIRVGVALCKFAIAMTIGGICAGAYFVYFVVPAIVQESEIREAKFAIRHAHRCGKSADLVRDVNGKWNCVRHDYWN